MAAIVLLDARDDVLYVRWPEKPVSSWLHSATEAFISNRPSACANSGFRRLGRTFRACVHARPRWGRAGSSSNNFFTCPATDSRRQSVRERVIQLFHSLIELDEPSAQLQLAHHLTRKAAQRLGL